MTSDSKMWPVIVNKSLIGKDILNLLQKRQNQLKIRVSNNTLEDSVIFPLSGVAFMVLDLHKITSQNTEIQEIYPGIHKLTAVHARCYLIVVSALYGEKELRIFSSIQKTFMTSQLRLLMVHSYPEAVSAMVSTAKVLCKPASDVMSKKLESIANHHMSCDIMAAILEQIGLDHHQIQVIQDSIGSLACLVTADRDDLLDCSLDSSTVTTILDFFGNNE